MAKSGIRSSSDVGVDAWFPRCGANKASVASSAPLDDEVELGGCAMVQGLTKAISQPRSSQQRDYRRIHTSPLHPSILFTSLVRSSSQSSSFAPCQRIFPQLPRLPAHVGHPKHKPQLYHQTPAMSQNYNQYGGNPYSQAEAGHGQSNPYGGGDYASNPYGGGGVSDANARLRHD